MASIFSLAKELALLLSLAILPVYEALGEGTSSWKQLTPGILMLRRSVNHHAIFSTDFFLLKISPLLFEMRVLESSSIGGKRAYVRDFARSTGLLAAINANFFDHTGAPLGVIISKGKLRNRIHRGGNVLTGIYQITRYGASIVSRDKFSSENVIEAFQAGPRLLAKGLPVDGIKEAPAVRTRSGVCITRKGETIIFHGSSSIIGISIGSMLDFLTSSEIGCVDALNLDGGGSSQLYVSKAVAKKEYLFPGTDPVPVFLGVVRRKAMLAPKKLKSSR